MKVVRAFSDRLVRRALSVHGTCTGEHGIRNWQNTISCGGVRLDWCASNEGNQRGHLILIT
ncbi:hypothetical protein COOONC_18436 [Cooperia oncophora]